MAPGLTDSPTGTVSGTETVATADGLHLRLRRWRPDGTPRAAVALIHGFAATADDGGVCAQASALAAAGFEVASCDGRGHGESGGQCTLGDLEHLDVAAVMDRLSDTGRPRLVIGASMGAIAVLRYAAVTDDDLAGVVAISAPAAWRAPRTAQGILATGLTQTRLGRRIARTRMRVTLSPTWSDPAPPTELVTRIAAPVALIHGECDHFIRPRDAVELYRHCSDPRRLDVVPGMGHAYHPLAVAPVVAAAEWALAASAR